MKKTKTFIRILFLFATCLTALAFAEEPFLSIKSGAILKTWTRSELLKVSHIIEVQNDPAYPENINKYQAVSVKSLFIGINVSKDAPLLFKCSDGFSAPISQYRLLNTSSEGAVPYIAIETPEKKWPQLKGKERSAGPFYLVWLNPQKSNISKEEWPYNLSGFEVISSIENEFPKIIPDSKLPESSKIKKGFKVFLKNCFACHTMNGEGNSKMGPDLNLPYNPTEYLKVGFIKKLIRNPQNLRYWPQAKMSAFPESVISNDELADLLSYLSSMSTRKISP